MKPVSIIFKHPNTDQTERGLLIGSKLSAIPNASNELEVEYFVLTDRGLEIKIFKDEILSKVEGVNK